jgi:hypothetical protein
MPFETSGASTVPPTAFKVIRAVAVKVPYPSNGERQFPRRCPCTEPELDHAARTFLAYWAGVCRLNEGQAGYVMVSDPTWLRAHCATHRHSPAVHPDERIRCVTDGLVDHGWAGNGTLM